MCGLCLPHCPTYRLDQHEAESPRGRIALARRLSAGQLEVSEAALAHLDHCLGCLSCQAVCPSQVQYEEILVQTRALLNHAGPPQSRGASLAGESRGSPSPARLRFAASRAALAADVAAMVAEILIVWTHCPRSTADAEPPRFAGQAV